MWACSLLKTENTLSFALQQPFKSWISNSSNTRSTRVGYDNWKVDVKTIHQTMSFLARNHEFQKPRLHQWKIIILKNKLTSLLLTKQRHNRRLLRLWQGQKNLEMMPPVLKVQLLLGNSFFHQCSQISPEFHRENL